MKEKSIQSIQLRQLLRYLRPYVGLITITILSIIVARIAATIEPLYLKRIIDFISVNVGAASVGSETIIALLAVYFSLRIISFFFEFLRDFFFAPVEMGVGRSVAEDLFDHLLRLPISFHHEQKTGTLARRIGRGAQSINFILDFLVINILPTIFELVFVTVLLIRLYPPAYGLTTLATVVGYALFTIWTTEARQKYRFGANMAEDEASAVQVETIYGIETVKYFGNERFQQKRFSEKIKNWYELSVRSNQLFGAISAGQSFILLLGFGTIVYLAVGQALAGSLTVGDLVLLTTYVVRLSVPVSTLGFVYRRIKDGLTDVSGMLQLLSAPIEIAPVKNPKVIKNPQGETMFDDVWFKYGKRQALKGLTLNIPAGKRVAIVGPSGAGKSTIVKLLFRLYDPERGAIKIDGVDLRQLSPKQRHDLIVLVPQETVLFNDTIEQNVKFGKPSATQREVLAALKLANLDGLIRRLPDGLKTVVGERGVKLSGGEKQRVAIARAIIKDPKILVFDEATSNLDAESEQEILRSINEVSRGRTTISIAHRLPTITGSDIIFVVDQGRLVESGTHEELLAKRGLYARLWQQFVR